MAFTRPNFSRHQVDLAGIRLVGEMPLWRRDYQNALAIANNWRSSHSYPLLAMRMTLAGRARRVDGDALVAQRLKRLRSTESKLRRLPHMKLSQMQDIGGCRAVVGSVQQVDDLVSLYELGTAKNPHKRAQFVEKYDYIAQPKGNGYRSVHLVYKYGSIRVSQCHFGAFWGFFVGELTGKALWKLVENAQRFPRRGGRVLRPRRRQLPQGPSVCDKMAPREGATRDIELDRRAGG